jgi:hypothetical protein
MILDGLNRAAGLITSGLSKRIVTDRARLNRLDATFLALADLPVGGEFPVALQIPVELAWL